MGQISGLWTQGIERKLCLEELISNLRLFLSAKGYLAMLRSSGGVAVE
jgi:hypothetical protein